MTSKKPTSDATSTPLRTTFTDRELNAYLTHHSEEALPPGVQTLNQCGEFYIISHNHALYQITSWGVPMTGPITFLRIDPPLPNSCP